ncbi:30S ribosomal protein S7 [Candidatus Peregrinibacteria bacterium]|nr:30S ribosomal protein S7 [Candidatus Peregrinibacteria bacterium]
MPQKKVYYIPEGSSPLQEKFINCIMKAGKKNLARKIFADTLAVIGKKESKNPQEVFQKAIENVKPNLEIRPKRIGGAVYQIPVEVAPRRQISLAIRWIVSSARGTRGRDMASKLASEILAAYAEQGSAFKKKEELHRMAQANKAFAHLARF